MSEEVEVEVVGVRIELPSSQPILILRALDRPRCLPIWIGAVEAGAIGLAQRGTVPPRPLTEHLVLDVLEQYGAKLEKSVITSREDFTFYADLVIDDGRRISARPSDAIALALTAERPILVDSDVLDSDGIDAPHADEEEVAQFREFLDHVSAEDFDPES